MSFARVARILAFLTALCACTGRGDSDGPLLPVIALPSTTVGLDYEVRLTATGGVAPLRYSVGEVPPGFSFYSATALLTGPATVEGEYTLTVGVTDAQGAQDSRTYALRVYAAPSVTSTTLPAASSGVSYSFVLDSAGGQPPLRWTLADGSLPPGVTLSVDGEISGVPRGLGSYPFTVRVQDANGALATRLVSLEVRGGSSTDGGTHPDGGVSFPLQVGNWNVEFFGDTGQGPTDEQLQFDNVRTVLSGANADFWGLAEIVDVTAFNNLKQALPGYDGFVASDSRVTDGPAYYSTGEQKVAVLYKSAVVHVLNAEVILGSENFNFASRPPLRVDLRVTRNGTSLDLVAIVLHMKADATEADYNRRQAAGVALKQYLDTTLPTARVLVLGDWNDDVDSSIVSGFPTPYQNYLDAPAAYTFVTQPLSSVSSTVRFPGFIDHQLVTNELAQSYVNNSAMVLRPAITSYGTTTSDHYPILSRFDFGQVAPPGPSSPVFINEFLPHPNTNPSTGQPDFDQQFVELVNTGAAALDVSGWKVHDAESFSGAKPARHTFPAGTTLAPGSVYVVYSGAPAVPAGATNAAYANGMDGLRLNRGTNVGSSGDTVYLVKPDGTTVDSYFYKDTFPGISYNRSPDVSAAGAWVRHDSLPSGLSASPGKRADGTSF
jgi:endonuclease/exonuclease/phosphatase family metal-dependent hydrolase